MFPAGYFAPGYFSPSYFGGGGIAEDGGGYVEPTHEYLSEPPLLCDPIYSDPFAGITPDWYGGGWLDSLPASNLADYRLSRVARSVDLDPANTLVRCWFKKTRRIQAVIIPRGNYTRLCEARVTLANSDETIDAGGVYQSEWLRIWPTWLDPERAYGRPVPFIHFTDDALTGFNASFAQIELRDPTNPFGYLQIDRALCTGVFAFPQAMNVGASFTAADPSESWTNDAGAKRWRIRPTRRLAKFTVEEVEEPVAFGKLEELDYRVGVSGQLFYIYGQHDPIRWKRSMLANIREKGPTEWYLSDATHKQWELEEVVG